MKKKHSYLDELQKIIAKMTAPAPINYSELKGTTTTTSTTAASTNTWVDYNNIFRTSGLAEAARIIPFDTHTNVPPNYLGQLTTDTNQWMGPNTFLVDDNNPLRDYSRTIYGGPGSVYGQNTYHFQTPKYDSYPSSEPHISAMRKEVVFKLFEMTSLDYQGLIKHLSMKPTLFNTLLLEYAVQVRTSAFMQLFARNSQFTPAELYGEVVKVYK